MGSGIVASRCTYTRNSRTAAAREAHTSNHGFRQRARPLSLFSRCHTPYCISLDKAAMCARAHCRDNYAFVQLRAQADAHPLCTSVYSARDAHAVRAAVTSERRSTARRDENDDDAANGMLTSDANCCLYSARGYTCTCVRREAFRTRVSINRRTLKCNGEHRANMRIFIENETKNRSQVETGDF